MAQDWAVWWAARQWLVMPVMLVMLVMPVQWLVLSWMSRVQVLLRCAPREACRYPLEVAPLWREPQPVEDSLGGATLER